MADGDHAVSDVHELRDSRRGSRGPLKWLREWWVVIAIFTLGAGIMVNYALLIPVLDTLSHQAKDGQLARKRQCDLFPSSLKLYRAAHKYHLLTVDDLRKFESYKPHCREKR